uniref:Myosin IHb n=1 Tax=Astyanax mexicanus TaxID=7994 RepID=A0A8B9KV59_ASTMX
MISEINNHFILISGESGAGKTEASKKILQFYAVSCVRTEVLDIVRDRLLLSNPVLEAFGNAKTLKNDNSSRFGKYMDIQFDHQGAAVGGHILSYLLEKSRVVHQNHGERNFHIFYQLVEGGEDELLHRLGLERNSENYMYLVEGECVQVGSINDQSDWKTVRKALTVIDFSERDIEVLSIAVVIASVLHLGNIHFEASRGYATLNSSEEIHWLSKLLGISANLLQEALTHRKIEAKGEEVLSPFTVDHAKYARDALAKAVYGRTFTWLVNKTNESLENKASFSKRIVKKTVIGLLDIYGFEVFDVNSFEQFCINYCNEKLQQLFIQLTIKSEQEEYEMEGIEWQPVPFFNNKIICDLVEEKHRGIISVLDEECLRPGEPTDLTFLEKLEEKLAGHPHFVTHMLADQKTRKTLGRGEFRLMHYAGEVTYSVTGFVDKNNDLLYRNIKDVMRQSKNPIIQQCFPSSEPDSKKRPETVATQFKNNLFSLTQILMSKEPWYVRCLKPNNDKRHFDDVLVRHQVKYLALMEHLRVRRAGFAYRRRYEVFLKRYKPLCPDTWPNWKGTAAEGVELLVKHLGYRPSEYKMGRSKIFIRHPRTLFATEDAFDICRHELGKAPVLYLLYCFISIEACWRGLQARKERERRAWAVKVIKKFIKGFMNRNQPVSMDNSEYLAFVRQSYLTRLRENLPTSVLDRTSWLTPPPIMQEVKAYKMFRNDSIVLCCTSFCFQLQMKALISDIFKGKKENYPQSVHQPFADTRISKNLICLNCHLFVPLTQYSVPVIKYDRNGFRPRFRQLVLTQKAAYLVEEAKIKQRYKKVNGDLVLQCSYLFEALTKLCLVMKNHKFIKVVDGSVRFDIQPGREGVIDFKSSSESMVYRAKNGHLIVVSQYCTVCTYCHYGVILPLIEHILSNHIAGQTNCGLLLNN